MKNQPETQEALAHALFTAAQLAPGEGIEDAVGRLAALVEAQQPAPSAAVATTVPRYTIEDMRQARRESYEQGVASAVPQKVTPAMRAAFREAYKDGSIWTDRLDRAVEAMLAAAPQPSPTPQADRQPAPVPTRTFLERTLAAMEGVIDVADRQTDEFEALRSCVIDLTVLLFSKSAPARDYPPLPMQFACSGVFPVYSADQMRAYVDADRAMRAARAQAKEGAKP